MSLNFGLCLIGFLGISAVSGQLGSSITIEAGDLGKIFALGANTAVKYEPFFAFNGIPYAEGSSYTGENRFKPSVVRTGLLTEDPEIPFNATNAWRFCPQRDILIRKPDGSPDENADPIKIIAKGFHNAKSDGLDEMGNLEETHDVGSEECLYLSVNTKNIPYVEGQPLHPVIMFLHGGSSDSIWGSLWNGLRLLEHDIVLVSINYRLGVLGALNLGIDEAPGNQAMYDAITALRWIKANIKHFGGDPEKVTVAGHSAGSMMATHLLLSPLAKDLVHGVIGNSGAANGVWGTAREPSSQYHLKVSEYAGCYSPEENTDILVVLECMKSKSPEELKSALSQHDGEQQRNATGLGFDAKSPSIQGEHLTIEKFITEMPADIIRQGKQNPIPLLIGATRHDGSFVFESVYNKIIKPNHLQHNATFLRNEFFSYLFTAMGIEDPSAGVYPHSIGYSYVGPDIMNSGNFTAMIPGLIDLMTVFGFKDASYKLVEEQSKLNPLCYTYSFDYKGWLSTYDISGTSDIPGGIAHIDDMLYLFGLLPLLKQDTIVSQRYVEYWARFATYGNPNGPVSAEEEFWPRYSNDSNPFLYIEADDRVGFNARDTWYDVALEIYEGGWINIDEDATTTTQNPTTDSGETTQAPIQTTSGLPNTDETTGQPIQTTTPGLPNTDETSGQPIQTTTPGLPNTDETTGQPIQTTSGLPNTDETTGQPIQTTSGLPNTDETTGQPIQTTTPGLPNTDETSGQPIQTTTPGLPNTDETTGQPIQTTTSTGTTATPEPEPTTAGSESIQTTTQIILIVSIFMTVFPHY